MRYATFVTFRGGQITTYREYWNPQVFLAALRARSLTGVGTGRSPYGNSGGVQRRNRRPQRLNRLRHLLQAGSVGSLPLLRCRGPGVS